MTRLYVVLVVLVAVLSLAASVLLYPQLPAQIPTHWNIRGEVDGYGAKTWAAFLVPSMLVLLLLLFSVIPWISPKPFVVDTFRSTYWFVVLVVSLLFAYIQGLMLWAALSGPVDPTRALLAGILAMFGVLGGVMGKLHRNFWMGVRTPWTIASERVWNDTHRLAGRLFVIAAAAGLLLVFLPLPLPAMSIAVFSLIMAAALVPVFYSLVHYKLLERRGEV